MALNCDCYPGCWGDHSDGWSEISDPDDKYRRAAIGTLEYGTYVFMPENVVRVENDRLAAELKMAVDQTSEEGTSHDRHDQTA